MNCTGLTAFWCPVHGSCRCIDTIHGALDDALCPLHSPESPHPIKKRTALIRRRP